MLAYGKDRVDRGIVVDLAAHAGRIEQLMPHTYRLRSGKDLRSFFLEWTDLDQLPATVPSVQHCRVLCIAGSDDASLNTSLVLQSSERFLQRWPGLWDVTTHVVEGANHGVDDMLAHGATSFLDRFLELQEPRVS